MDLIHRRVKWWNVRSKDTFIGFVACRAYFESVLLYQKTSTESTNEFRERDFKDMLLARHAETD